MKRAAAIALAWALGAGSAYADDAPVRLTIDACAGVDSQTVARIVEVEMRASLTDRTRPDNLNTTQVEVGCDGGLLVLRAIDPITGKRTSRRIDLGTALARERTLALSIVELVVASWSELSVVDEPAAPIVERTSSPKARGAVRRRIRDRIAVTRDARARPSVALLVRAAHTSAGAAAGAGARLRIEGDALLGWGVELAAHRARADRARGTVGVDFSGGAVWADVHLDWRALRARAGAGLRLELVRMTGEVDDGAVTVADSFSALGGGPLVAGGVGYTAGPITVELGGQIVYRFLGVRGRVTNDRDVDLSGVSLSASLGVGWQW